MKCIKCGKQIANMPDNPTEDERTCDACFYIRQADGSIIETYESEEPITDSLSQMYKDMEKHKVETIVNEIKEKLKSKSFMHTVWDSLPDTMTDSIPNKKPRSNAMTESFIKNYGTPVEYSEHELRVLKELDPDFFEEPNSINCKQDKNKKCCNKDTCDCISPEDIPL